MFLTLLSPIRMRFPSDNATNYISAVNERRAAKLQKRNIKARGSVLRRTLPEEIQLRKRLVPFDLVSFFLVWFVFCLCSGPEK